MSFDTTGMQVKEMTINLETILPSLAKNLYGDDWRIAIRELLQNCHDALAEAKEMQLAKAGGPQIDVVPDLDAGTLTFKDNGIGMTHDEVEKYLATVGYGRKREQLEKFAKEGKGSRAALNNIIGQYGIGFLASFIIADAVEVRTKSQVIPQAPGVRALFTGETRWYSSEDRSANFGTEVLLRLKREPIADPATGKKIPVQDLLNFERLKQEVRRFGDLLPYPIQVHRGPRDLSGDLSNSIKGPWEKDPDDVPGFFDFLRGRHAGDNDPLSPVAFAFNQKDHKVTAHGLIYFPVPGEESKYNIESVAQVELMCRRMFISNDITALLPEWATFVGIVVECPDLTPTLNRNDVIRHEPAFVALKEALGQRITEIIQHLAEKEGKTFRRLRSDHHDRLYKALLSDYHGDEKFFRAIINHIPFNVIYRTRPEGETMTLLKYREEFGKRQRAAKAEKRDRLFFLHDPASMGQFRAMIIQRDIPVVLALHGAERSLLLAYGQAFSDEVVVEDVAAILDLYVEDVEQAPYEAMKQFLSTLDGGGPDEAKASRFEPSYIPAILIVKSAANPEQAAVLERILNEGGSVFDPKARRAIEDQLHMAKLGRAQVTVCLNDNNGVVRLIRDHCIKGKPLTGAVGEVLHELYHSARAQGDPEGSLSPHFFEHRNSLLARLLEADQSLALVQGERDQLAIELKALQAGPRVPANVEPRDCALLLTDLRGSTRMVGFLNRAESAEILQLYARKIRSVVEDHGGHVEKFTGDGVFAYFGLDSGRVEVAAQTALACASQINLITATFFTQGSVADTLMKSGITVDGCRTVLHCGLVMFGEFAGTAAIVGPQVVALFRACERDDLFKQYPCIVTLPFLNRLNPPNRPAVIAQNVELDRSLPPMTFFPHPAFVGGAG